jgi:DNA primase
MIETFDLISYLQDKGIEYLEEGKNVTSGWVEVNCPFCMDDPSMHLGISPTRLINCWRCGAKGSVIKYIKAIENCSWEKAKDITKKYVDPTLLHLRYDIMDRSVRSGKGTIIPKEAKGLNEEHYQYLMDRGFDPVEIERKYKLKAVSNAIGTSRKFKYRIIIPVFLNGIAVNFTALDFTGKRGIKYIHLSNEEAILPMKDCLYNIDSLRDIALIVEGVTDVWRMGDGAIATMGIEVTSNQINLLLKKKPKKCFVMFDAEPLAQKKAKKLAETLSGFVVTELLELDSGDPGDLTFEESYRILKEIGLK